MPSKLVTFVTRRGVILAVIVVAAVVIAAVAGVGHVRPYSFWDGPG